MKAKTIQFTVSIGITYNTPQEYLKAIRDAKNLILNSSVECTYSVKPNRVSLVNEKAEIKKLKGSK